jgi:uncharacterized SAM-binding protein YcdF (DUF218 family)
VLDLLREFDPQVTIYYCIDDLASSSPGARRIVPSEQRLFQEADLVFVTSQKLFERASEFTRNVHLFPFGVNFERFDAVRNGSAAPPDDMRALPRPVVGYVGGLHQWVDQPLVAELAARMPDTTFVLVGPAQADVSTLARCANIHLLGQRSHADVPHYVKAFDVGIVPYRLTEYTANVYPTKLNEYLVMGKPVVATDLREIRRFNADHDGIVSVAADPEQFAAALVRALTSAAPGDMDRRIAVAHSNSWQSRITAMSALIDAAIERRSASKPRWDETLRRAYRLARNRVAQVIVALLILYAAVFETNLVWWGAAPLKLTAPPARADAIVVFAGGVGESGRAGGGAQERLKQAVDLYKAGYAPWMILSSGYVYSLREAEVMQATAISLGVPPSAIVLEQRAANTYENVRFVDEILSDHHWTRILLVSSPYHMRRALLVWHRQAPGVTVVPTPAPESEFDLHQRGASFEQVRAILQEYLAIAAYWRRGWL